MSAKDQLDRMRSIAAQDGRYSPEAFLFVSKAIGQTVEWIKKGVLKPEDAPGSSREEQGGMFHVSGKELLAGFRRLARERWGLLAPRVLESWGVQRTEDVGEIVFLMVEDEELQWRRRPSDTREDFANGFDFEAAFDPWGRS